jgi:hypothetical protein
VVVGCHKPISLPYERSLAKRRLSSLLIVSW